MATSDAVVSMDRFVSASSAQDAINSLEKLVDAFKNNGRNHDRNEEEKIVWDPAWIFEHEEIAEHLIWLLQHGTLKANEIPCEDGVNLVCQLYKYLIKTPEALKKPSPGLLLESLLDVLDNSENPIYVRVLALKVLEDLSKRHKSIAVNQWLQAPNGLHRIADLLAIDVDNNPMEEAIRDQALIVAKSLAREAPIAKVFLFAEVECKLLDLCWKKGGLTKGNPVVIDALELIQEILKHTDASLQDLMLQRPNVAPRLCMLLDLRGGDEFLHPTQKSLKATQEGNGGDDDDDLDSLLASGDAKPKEDEKVSLEESQIPRLLPAEENVIKLVLNILRLLLETDSVRHVVWKQHNSLCNMVWDLALVNNPMNPPVCALPSSSLQQEALNVVADKFNDPITMDHLSGLDRLLSLVCTGGGISDKFDDKLGLSQSALAVLRQSLPGDRIHDILMRTLAPPPTEDENAPPPGPTVVQKLWNTVQENLSSEVSEQRTIFLSGALGGLGLMLCDEQSREIMSKVAPIGLDRLLESLSEESDGFVQCSLVRFFCEWIYECPFIAHSILCSTASTHLAGMAAATSSYQSLTHLLLGLAMEYLTKEEECGGWTRNGILQIIIKIGISKYTLSLEGLKRTTNPKMPWVVSEMEYKNWKKICSQSVLTVRKRVVEELAGGSSGTDDESDGDHSDIVFGSDGTSLPPNQKIKPLQKLISQQSKEMDEMRKEMHEMRARLTSQDDQLSTWKRRMESTPTELDDLLNEFTSKNVKLEETMITLESEVERQKSEKETETKLLEGKLSESRGDADRIRTQEQEVRDDLERTEQEMQALSQAYASLEEEYQRNQNHQNAGAPAEETSQQIQGEVSHQQSGIGSTEVATLRAENTRLKNDARAADEWMSMAVQKLNDMGGANVDLEKQVAGLNSQIVESQAVADNISINSQNGKHQIEILELELKEEKSLRVAADQRASSSDNSKIELEREQQNSKTLARRITEAQEALSKYENMDMQIQSERKRYAELENRIFEAEEEIRVTTSCLEDERNAKFEIEKQLSVASLSNISYNDGPIPTQDPNNDQKLELLRSEYDAMATTKNTEIEGLTLSLQKIQRDEQTFKGDTDTKDIEKTKQEINEIRERSQEEIYRLESVIRELKDRLGSGLGAYKVEDIRARDGEIEEMRTANEAAQEWMNKAVEHHQRNSTQISNLSEEKAALTLKLEEERMKVSSQKMNDPSSIQNELVQKIRELDLMNEKFARIEVELDELKKEKEANQGLLDELGIAVDDVKIMQQQLAEYKAIVTNLETKLSVNRLDEENDELRSSNKYLQTKLKEFEDWTQAAQNKIADIMAAKDKAEIQLLGTTEELQSLQKENKSLHTNLAQSQDDKCALEKLREDVAMLESRNDSLSNEPNDRESQYADLQSQYNILFQKSHDSEQESNSVLAIRNDLEKDLMEERQLSIVRCAEIDDLKAENVALSGSLEKIRNGLDDNQATPTESMITESIDLVKEQNDKTGNVHEEAQVARINELLGELDRTNDELATANEALSRDEDVVREWEDRVSQLESELANALLQMQEQETEAMDAIAKWQLNSTESEEKCAELEEKLKKALDLKESIDVTNNTPESEFLQLKEDNFSLQEHIKELEISLAEKSGHEFDSVSELQEALKIAQETLTRDEEVVQKWEERVTELETNRKSLQTELQEQEDKANDVISKWQDNCAAAELKSSTIEEELEEIKKSKHSDVSIGDTSVPVDQTLVDTLAKKENELRKAHEDAESNKQSMQELKDRIQEVSHQIESIKKFSGNEQLESNYAIEQLEEKFTESEKENTLLRDNLEEAKSNYDELQALRNTISNDDQIVHQWEERVNKLTDSIAVLEDQLKEQENEACDAIALWQVTCSDFEMKCSNLEFEVKNSRETVSIRNWSIEQLMSRNESYCAHIKQLNSASLKFESSVNANLFSATTEIATLNEVLEVERKNKADEHEQLQAKIAVEKEYNHEARDEIETLTSSLEEIKIESEDTLNQWTTRYEEIDRAFREVQQQLEGQEHEANEVISMWESKTEELEKELDHAEDQLQRLEDILIVNDNEDDTNLVDVAESILQENNNLNCHLQDAKSLANEHDTKAQDFKSQIETLEAKLSNREDQFQGMKLERDRMKHQLSLKSQDKLEEECDRLIGEVAQIGEELREANAMLQACVTDGSTDKATEVASYALRDEVNNMRNHLNEYQQKYEDEKSAREVADLEIIRLRDDIAVLLSLSEHENNPTNLKKLTTKSIEKLQKIEHTEIVDLRKSLFRAMEELELTRSAEKDSNETLSKLRLHISVYEQEIIAAKSEVNFLSEAMEELRQTEDSKRASLEYRIGSLENENDVVRKYQAAELENVRNELAQVSMEKDMIMHKIKETEKTNASLILAVSKEDRDNSPRRNSIESECAKLRVENAHLLTVVEEEEEMVQRRLRELLSAQIASSELDVILERELRLSAEAARAILQDELSELRSDSTRLSDRKRDNGQKKSSDSITDELNSLRSFLDTMKKENDRLKITMNEEASKAKHMIDILTEECRKAQAKACKFDRDTRTELAVQSEIAKMRLPALASNGDRKSWNEDYMNNSTSKGPSTENYEASLPSAEAFDLIRKQKEEIQEERMMYSETLQEHDDLLALVAQQDLEKCCLREALIEVAGYQVADEAMKRAEEFAVNRYGNALQVVN